MQSDFLQFAYLDPGTGAVVLQVVLATILGAGVVFRRFFLSPVMRLWGRKSGPTPPDSTS